MIYNEPPVAWRFVDNVNKLQVNKSCAECGEETPFYQVPSSYLPSFCWSGDSFFSPLTMELIDPTGTLPPVDVLSYFSPLITATINGQVIVAFPGQDVPEGALPDGVWQCQISDGINTLYSEPIKICDNFNPCTVIKWSNSCDVYGIPYTYIDGAGLPLINRYYLDSPIIQGEFETEIEESINLLRQPTVIYRAQDREFYIEDVFPEYAIRTLNAMIMHDAITIEYGDNTYTSDSIHSLSVEAEKTDGSDCDYTAKMFFKQDDQAVSGICCVSNSPADCLETCEDVLGFVSDFESWEVGGNYIEDVDADTIVTYDNRGNFVNPRSCSYVNNITTGNTMWFNGDVWLVVPELTFVSAGIVSGGLQPITLSATMIAGTFGYLQYSCDNISFSLYTVPFTAAQIATSVTFNIPVCGSGTYYLKISMLTHNCDYGFSNTLTITPE